MAASLKEYRESIGNLRPVVSKVATQVKRANRVSVFVDDAFAFGLSEGVARRNGLERGSVLDPSLLSALEHDEAIARCRRVALNYISYRMRSESEVRQRLTKEEAGPDVITTVLDQLRDTGLVDDGAFALAYSRDAVVGRKWGPHRIASGLRRAGVGDTHVSQALQEIRNTIEDEDIVRVVATKRWSQLSSIADERKRKKRLYDYLTRRGFDFQDVRRVVDELTS